MRLLFTCRLLNPSQRRSPNTRQIQIFVKKPKQVKYSVVDLPKEAVGAQLSENAAAKLKLDVSPSDVDIALEKENGEQVLLDEIKSIAEQGVRDGSKVLVTVREPSFSLTYFNMLNGKKNGPRLEQPIGSNAMFNLFLKETKLWLMRKGRMGDQRERRILDLDEAIAASNEEGTYFAVEDVLGTITEVITRQRRFDNNVASSLQRLSTYALAKNETLRQKYGGRFSLVNGGRPVLFRDKLSKKPFVEIDGMVTTPSVCFINESKMKLQESDIPEIKLSVDAVQKILEMPEEFLSEPSGIIEQLSGLQIVPVASTIDYDANVEQACRRKGVHLLHPDGDGFSCILHESQTGP